ncbi:WD repeat-containing protein [Acrasis kona]|uniref:WD repeat-containing protein n=1 Tax=Acrasis kona TaxID=1008807 RepID=A0AAW2ZPF5_9EUKA
MDEVDAGANFAISSVCWVPRGAFALNPKRTQQPTQEDIDRMMKEGRVGISTEQMDEEDDQGDAQNKDNYDDAKINEELKEFDFENYDNSDEEEGVDEYNFTDEYFKSLGGRNARAFKDNAEDPYLKGNDSESSDDEDYDLDEEDIQLLAISNEEDATTSLQVYVYEEEECNLFLHHDVLLQTYGLCVEWLNYDYDKSGGKHSLVATGTFEPIIEIWDADVIDPLEPIIVLGEANQAGGKKKKKKQTSESHTGAVLGLAWHRTHHNIIGSASDDKTVKLWDISTGKVRTTLTHHTEPVQSIKWHLVEDNILLTGGFDKKCSIVDCGSKKAINFQVGSDIESMVWNPHQPNVFSVSCDDGKVFSFDIRNNGSALIKLQAHDKSCSDVSYNNKVPNILATGSHDGKVKIWNYADQKLLYEKNMGLGDVYTASFNSDYLLAVGGANEKLRVIDVRRVDQIKSLFL